MGEPRLTRSGAGLEGPSLLPQEKNIVAQKSFFITFRKLASLQRDISIDVVDNAPVAPGDPICMRYGAERREHRLGSFEWSRSQAFEPN